MYHIELRQFPHNLCRFNLSERELLDTVLDAWAQGEWVELGERKWSPHQARLTVLEGPKIPVEQLSMGRGWRGAQRQSEDVTERVLARAKPAAQAPPADPPEEEGSDGQLRTLLGADPDALLRAWRLAAERRPGRPPSEALALAETMLKALDEGAD